MARKADTYRGWRRNACKERREVWDRSWYYSGHRADYHRRTVLSKTPSRYHPIKSIGDYLVSIGKRWGKQAAAA